METRYLQTLLKAVESGSFSRAAQELNITQSAASQRVKFLEDLLGHQLLDRSGPKLQPTDAGELVLQQAREILRLEQELQRGLKQLEGQKHISFGCTPTFGSAYLPLALNRFILNHSDLADFKFIFGTPEQALRGLIDNSYDLVVIEHCGELELKGLSAFRLPPDELAFISAPALSIPPGPVTLEQLFNFRIFVRKEGCSSRQLLRSNLAHSTRSLDHFAGVVISDDLRLTIQSVQAGGGISFLSRSLVHEQLEQGILRAHTVASLHHQRNRTAVLNLRREGDPLLLQFLECVYAVFPSASLAELGLSSPQEFVQLRLA